MNLGFNTVQEKFKELKSEDNDNMLLLNKLLDEISKLKKDIAKVSQNNFHTCNRVYHTRYMHMTRPVYYRCVYLCVK